MADPFALLGGLLMMSGVAVALRWTFGTGHNLPGPRDPDADDPTGYGLLDEVSRVPTEAAADALRARLAEAGIRATVGHLDRGGYRLLVFRDELALARIVLSRRALE